MGCEDKVDRTAKERDNESCRSVPAGNHGDGLVLGGAMGVVERNLDGRNLGRLARHPLGYYRFSGVPRRCRAADGNNDACPVAGSIMTSSDRWSRQCLHRFAIHLSSSKI